MKRKQIHFTEQQIEALKQLSARDGLTVAEHARRAVDKYVKEMNKPSGRKG